MYLKYFFAILLFAISMKTVAQTLNPDHVMDLQKMEDSLKNIAPQIIHGRSAVERFQADSMFTRQLVQALKIKGSFHYPFDSLRSISIVTPKDSSFRIFTWQLVINENTIRQHGAIQMNTTDGSLKLFPLIDKTPAIKNDEDTITDNFNWVGALYYMIVEKEAFGKKYYTLLGYDENNIRSNRKVIEILTFENGKPVFGGGNFSFKGSKDKSNIARYIMTYKKKAGPRLTYDDQLGMIVMEHLVSESGEPEKKYTYIPDGDYEGLKWIDGKWVYIPKIFHRVTPEGKPPVPQPIEESKLGLLPEGNTNDK